MPAQAKRTGVIARKMGMTRVFDEAGMHVPVTVLTLDEVQVVGVKRDEERAVITKKGGEVTRNDGYTAVVVGGGSRKAKRVPKAQRGQFAKAEVAPKEKIVEFRVDADMLPEVGAVIGADHFVPGQKVDVVGITIGRGFTGAMKRWNFGGLRATHGVSLSHRSHGSTGQRQDPGKVFKGKKMAGHYGVERVTIQNLEIVRTDAERGILFVRGAVPGHEGSWVEVRDAVKVKRPDAAPVPGAFRKMGEAVSAVAPDMVHSEEGGE